MGLDIKVPIGLMFTILGLLLTIFGLATSGNAEMYQRSTGAAMLLVGIVMLATSKLKPGNGE